MLRIDLYRLSIPLKHPYHLSFATVNHFDTFIAVVSHGEKIAYGESTALPGYSWETPNSIWQVQKKWLAGAGASARRLRAVIEADLARHPFAATALYTALEKIQNPLDLKLGCIPLVGIISTDDLKKAEKEAATLLSLGYSTLKVKVKGDPEVDLSKIRLVQSVANGQAKLRIDANQGYNPETIRSFMERVSPGGIELFEQPFKPSDWQEMQQLAKISPLPLMLDESIWSREDIEKTIELQCARYIKLKLVKHSSPRRTLELIRFARQAGLGVVLGNGVQTDCGCWDEAIIYLHAALETDGEFNGFLKQQRGLFSSSALVFENGKMQLLAAPTVNMDALRSNFARDRISYKYEWDFKEGESHETC